MSVIASSSSTAYLHTQRAAWYWILYVIAGVMAVTLIYNLHEPVVIGVSLTIIPLFLLLGTSFQQLTVADAGDRLKIQFGPLPLFARSIRYDEIQQIEIGRTTLFEGWGIHFSLRGGWVWNLSGRNCVVIRSRSGVLRLGTDDAGNLASFLRRRAGLADDSRE